MGWFTEHPFIWWLPRSAELPPERAPICTPSTTNLPYGKISGKPGRDITFYPLPRKTILHDWRRGPSGKWFDDAPGHLMRRWRELQQKGPVFYDFDEAYRER